MKKRQTLTVLMLVATLMLTCAATANCEAEDARVLLLRCWQEGVGARCEAVFLDEAGRMWQYQSDEPLPDTDAERLAFLSARQDVTLIRQLDANRVFELESLIAAAGEPQMEERLTDTSDGGLNAYTAVRYDTDGAAEFIPLAAMDNQIMENREPNAYALYIACFTEVMGYDLEAELDTPMKPSIPRIPLSEFLGLDADIFESATLTASRQDCEAGSIDLALDEQQARQKLAWLSNLVVNQKQNALNVTGDTEVYTLHSSEGDFLANVSFYNGLLVTNDGMYGVQCAEEK